MAASTSSRVNRLALVLPLALVALLAAAWSGFWVHMRGRVEAGLDGWIGREAAAGRRWSCAERAISGFPFRLEVRCAELVLSRPADASAPGLAFGRLLGVAQIYEPGLLVAEVGGPLALTWSDGRKAALSWAQAQMSLRHALGRPERGSFVAEAPVLAVSGFALGEGEMRAQRFELHARGNSGRPAAEQPIDLALSLRQLVAAGLDRTLGTKEPADIALEATLTQAFGFAGGVTPATADAWRAAGGALEFQRIAFRKGKAEYEGSGRFALDELHRPIWRIEGAQAGFERIGGVNVGPVLDAGALFSGKPAAQMQGGRALKPLPPVEARGGKLHVGPLRLPGLELPPLY